MTDHYLKNQLGENEQIIFVTPASRGTGKLWGGLPLTNKGEVKRTLLRQVK